MGSGLVDRDGKVVWGLRPGLVARQVVLGDVLARLRLAEGAPDDGVRPSQLVRFPVKLPFLGGLDPYTPLLRRLEDVVLAPEALLAFPYDWRRPVAEAGARLETAALAHLEQWRARWERLPAAERGPEEPRLTLVCHSMGGLVARWFAEVLGGREVVRVIVTLGTPFAGALGAVRLLADGRYLPLGLLAGELRAAARTFPGVYDLVARYECLAGDGAGDGAAGGDGLRALVPADLAAFGASGPMAEAAAAHHARVVAAAPTTPVRPLVGMRQPTLQGLSIVAGEAVFHEHLAGTDYGGDGTVHRHSAWPAAPAGIQPAYLPQRHGALAKSSESLTFVEAVLTERVLGPMQADAAGIGLRVPEAAVAGRAFEVVLDVTGPPGVPPACRVVDADTGRQVAAPRLARRDERWVGTLELPAGLYRVVAAGGGLSEVEELVLVAEEA
jgi:hypothetical protein